MDRHEFVLHRVAFTGLPYAAIRQALLDGAGPHAWRRGMVRQARLLRDCARRAAGQGAGLSAAQYMHWAGLAYHGATLGPDLAELESLARVHRLRRLAVASCRRALRADAHASEVTLVDGSARLAGCLRRPPGAVRGLVLLLNGLDSLCEVELHAFGSGLLERGIAALALDLPARYRSACPPGVAVESWAGPLRRWLQGQALAGVPVGVFGVSFGGYLAARFAAAQLPVTAVVAVSPPAWLEPRHLQHPYFARMLQWSFGTGGAQQIDRLAAAVTLEGLPGPVAPMRVYEMTEDALFGPPHVRAYESWGAGRVEVVAVAAEHVGTSRFYCWLPGAFDWIVQRFANA